MDVSIIIPLYNVEPFIEKCLKSVISQTYNGKIECILVDDCGNDNSASVAIDFINKYNKKTNFQNNKDIHFKLLRHTTNRGAAAARNTGLDNAQGAWIYFLDADDWISNDCISIMMHQVELYPMVDAVFGGMEVVNGFHYWASYKEKKLPKYTTDEWWINISMLKRDVLGMGPCNKLFRSNLFKEKDIRFIEGMKYEDEILNMQLSIHIRSLCTIKEETYYYFKHEGSTMAHNNNSFDRFYIQMKTFHIMAQNILGKRWQVQNQVKMLAGWSVGASLMYWPHIKRMTMPLLLLKLAIKARSRLSIYLFIQALLAIVKSPTYRNDWFFKRMTL